MGRFLFVCVEASRHPRVEMYTIPTLLFLRLQPCARLVTLISEVTGKSEFDHGGQNTRDADTPSIKSISFHRMTPRWHLHNNLHDKIVSSDIASPYRRWTSSALSSRAQCTIHFAAKPSATPSPRPPACNQRLPHPLAAVLLLGGRRRVVLEE